MAKILVIGQALPAVKQTYPYDTTMWYDWLKAIGISKEQSDDIFTYTALFNDFPGRYANGSHKPPLKAQRFHFYNIKLKQLISEHQKIIVLGKVAEKFLSDKVEGKEVVYIIHPSRRNYSKAKPILDSIIQSIKNLVECQS